MNVKQLVVLVVAIGAAGMAAYLAHGMLGEREPTIVEVEAPKVQQIEILVSAGNIPMGDRLETNRLIWKPWPDDAITANMITKKANPDALEVYGSAIARTPIFEGDPVIRQRVIKPDEGGFMAALLPEGMRAISVRISAETGAGGFILPNDRVDVLLTRDVRGRSGRVSETVLTNVRALAIDQTFRETEQGNKVVVGKTATLELTPEQAKILALAEASGQLTLTLRSIADSSARDGPVTSDEFIGGGNTINIVRYGVSSSVSGN